MSNRTALARSGTNSPMRLWQMRSCVGSITARATTARRRSQRRRTIFHGVKTSSGARSTIRRADQQMAAFSSVPDVKRIVYLVINFDDALGQYIDGYLAQIQERREEFLVPGVEVVLDMKPRVLGFVP